ncbi:MAG TPA: Holliday junction branch migration protein RuvA [Candidatus Gastranaerophilaceae bacterium]|nr:Holliday junction branch migration protein RuvA [Candidatus Gastranaerophilaceae bacterium]
MYDYILGEITNSYQNNKGCFLVLESNKVGYLIETNSRILANLPDESKEYKIYTILIHKEDSMSLFGFLKREDRDIFKTLTSVSGVGPKMALMLLDEFEAADLISLVIRGEYKELTRAKGVGDKLAQKIILELKDKLINFDIKSDKIQKNTILTNNQHLQDAQSVLISLGYTKEEINKAFLKAEPMIKNMDKAENILKETLKVLSL